MGGHESIISSPTVFFNDLYHRLVSCLIFDFELLLISAIRFF